MSIRAITFEQRGAKETLLLAGIKPQKRRLFLELESFLQRLTIFRGQEMDLPVGISTLQSTDRWIRGPHCAILVCVS